MTDIIIEKYNSVSNKIHCEPAIARELNEYFTFQSPGAKYHPLVKAKKWDGKIRLFHMATQLIYGGLNHYIETFAEERNYTIGHLTDFEDEPFTVEDAKAFCDKLQLTMEVRDYQLETFVHAIQKRRALFLSPTSSGKSFMIYLICKYLKRRGLLYWVKLQSPEFGWQPDDRRNRGVGVVSADHLLRIPRQPSGRAPVLQPHGEHPGFPQPP